MTFAVAGAACALLGAISRKRDLPLAGLALGALGWFLALFYFQPAPAWQNFAAVIVFPAACRVARKISRDDFPNFATPYLTWATMIGVTVWSVRWLNLHQPEFALTVLWTVLALLFSGLGLTFKDRHYRLGGLALIGISVGRVFLVDVWRLDQVWRIITFILLGVALLVLGYFYNRFEEKLRQWI